MTTEPAHATGEEQMHTLKIGPPDIYGNRRGLLDGEPVRIVAFGTEHPCTKEKFTFLVERDKDMALIGLNTHK